MSDQSYRIIPKKEDCCVWMTAGILGYQLCERSFDCDRCPLDAAMKQHFSAGRPAAAETAPVPSGDLPDDHRYTAGHFWVKEIEPSVFRIGIEPTLAKALLVPRAVILPDAGEKVSTSSPCLWFILDETTLPVPAVFDGVVLRHNESLTDKPYKVFFHPFDQGWLFDIAVGQSPSAPLLDAREARRSYADDLLHFRERLQSALQPVSIGQTLADGGQPLQDISSMLGPSRYYQLVAESFLKK
ncbi:MAG TPA: hypothetical protein VMW43_02795 [Bacteroidota bacterium]|nr:hypothetical protein [Bacteroidota bacterium]